MVAVRNAVMMDFCDVIPAGGIDLVRAIQKGVMCGCSGG